MGRNPIALYDHLMVDLLNSHHNSPMPWAELVGTHPSRCLSAEDAAVASLLQSIVKKFEPPVPVRSRADKAIALFLQCNQTCAEWTKPTHGLASYVIDEMRYLAFRDLGPISWDGLLSDLTVGPGASVGSRGKNSFLEKIFLNEFTMTDTSLYGEYLRFMRQRPSWLQAEFRRRELRGESAVIVVDGSSLSTVPKTDSIDRTICTEPSLNMAFQLALGEAFNRALRRVYGYCPASQPDRNRALARKGSLDGSVATIDLKSASDTISLSLCEYVLPADWFAAIEDCRSPMTRVNGEFVTLNMVSSMGNGFTFPLQTYLFSLAMRALCRVLSRDWHRYDTSCVRIANKEIQTQLTAEFGVFGDDIICPASLFDPMVTVLTSIGFTVNVDKSFHEGPFRESCGTDWYKGVNVRGVYVRRLDGDHNLFSAVNRLLRWSHKWGYSFPHTIQYLLPQRWRSFIVPPDESDTAGVKGIKPPLRHAGFRYRALKPRVKLARIFWKDLLIPAFDNPTGVWLAASVGALQSRGLGRRNAEPTYSPGTYHTFVWCDPGSGVDSPARKRRWEDTCYANLPIV